MSHLLEIVGLGKIVNEELGGKSASFQSEEASSFNADAHFGILSALLLLAFAGATHFGHL